MDLQVVKHKKIFYVIEELMRLIGEGDWTFPLYYSCIFCWAILEVAIAGGILGFFSNLLKRILVLFYFIFLKRVVQTQTFITYINGVILIFLLMLVNRQIKEMGARAFLRKIRGKKGCTVVVMSTGKSMKGKNWGKNMILFLDTIVSTLNDSSFLIEWNAPINLSFFTFFLYWNQNFNFLCLLPYLSRIRCMEMMVSKLNVKHT